MCGFVSPSMNAVQVNNENQKDARENNYPFSLINNPIDISILK